MITLRSKGRGDFRMITLRSKGRVATLSEGIWTSEDSRYARLLNLAFPQEIYPDSPSSGISGSSQAEAAAESLNGKIHWDLPVETNDSDRVY